MTDKTIEQEAAAILATAGEKDVLYVFDADSGDYEVRTYEPGTRVTLGEDEHIVAGWDATDIAAIAGREDGAQEIADQIENGLQG